MVAPVISFSCWVQRVESVRMRIQGVVLAGIGILVGMPSSCATRARMWRRIVEFGHRVAAATSRRRLLLAQRHDGSVPQPHGACVEVLTLDPVQ
jgi:hypothetical protein